MATTSAPQSEALSAGEARRIFLNAQGLATRASRLRGATSGSGASAKRVAAATHAAASGYLQTQGVLQLDTVNVLARAHHVPMFSRGLGSPVDTVDDALWGPADGHSAMAFEHWGHEATVMPLTVLPAMHWRMVAPTRWNMATRARLEEERPGLLRQVWEHVEEHGPVQAGHVEHLAPRAGKKGPWWDYSHVKSALELLFITGEVAASRGKNFTRTYDSTERAWGLSPASSGEWGLPSAQGHQQLFDRAIAACGIGTVRDLCDHYRLPYAPGARGADAAGGEAWAASAVERGLATWVAVEGWKEPALLAIGEATAEAPWHRAARDPGRSTAVALLSPFDPVCWFRPRLERMFAVDYRIEIYTPAPKRVYGYYCLPFLLGDQIVARVDLKADRKASVLRVESAWREPHAAPGARRRRDGDVSEALTGELRRMADWLGLADIAWAARGNLQP